MTTLQRPRKIVRRPRTSTGTWQAEKSHLTRMQILEATMQCLVDLGYAQTTTEKIALQAGVSRGAMTHHFKSRAEVLAAAAAHITDLRAVEYDAAIKGISLPVEALPTLESMRETMVVLQKYYASPSFIALQELLRGARTDKELMQIMAPLEERLDQSISESIARRFPVWTQFPETSELLRDLILSSMQGIAIDPVHFLEGERLQRFLDLLALVAITEFEKAYDAAHGPKALRKAWAVRSAA